MDGKGSYKDNIFVERLWQSPEGWYRQHDKDYSTTLYNSTTLYCRELNYESMEYVECVMAIRFLTSPVCYHGVGGSNPQLYFYQLTKRGVDAKLPACRSLFAGTASP